MNKSEKKMKSQRERRRLVVGLYGSFLVVSSLLSVNDLSSYPERFQTVFPWFGLPLMIGSSLLFIFCLMVILGANLGGIFSEPRDERQQTAAMRAYSLAYRILGAFVLIPGFYILVANLWFFGWSVPTSLDSLVLAGEWLILLVGTLPKAVAAWLEPDPIAEDARDGMRKEFS